ncbi:MAG: hypothetical protein PHO67_08180 [Candidatus Omnitrophica bacterium]|nr:hypothetical protein [Candidatus Omnitrophota bacterium]
MSNETLFRDGKMPVDETKEYPLMKCGCVAPAITRDGKPACVVHAGKPEALQLDRMVKGNHGLEGRKAKCSCRHEGPRAGIPTTTDSYWCLPFFEYHPDKEFDRFYCGCFGWD